MTRRVARRAAACAGIAMLGAALVFAPQAFAWGRRMFGGGFGDGGFGAGSFAPGGFNQENGYGDEAEGGFSGDVNQMYIYPSRGQSSQQEQNDKAQCYNWAAQQSGFNPANPQLPSTPPPVVGPPQGGLLRGGIGGGALGAIGGAIGGNAGKGAAIGASVGGLFGAMRRRSWQEQVQSEHMGYMEQQRMALEHGSSNFNQAFGVCMTGRGYTVG